MKQQFWRHLKNVPGECTLDTSPKGLSIRIVYILGSNELVYRYFGPLRPII